MPGVDVLVDGGVLELGHHGQVFQTAVLLAADGLVQLLHGERAGLQPGLAAVIPQLSMQAPFEQFVLRELVHPTDVFGDAEDHLAKKKGIALARGETVPKHVPQALDPAPQRLGLLELGSEDAVLDHRLHKVPDIVRVLDGRHLPPAQFRIDITEELLE